MPVTLEQIAGFLDKLEVKYQRNPEREALEISLKLDKYRDHDGDNSILVIVRASLEGQSITARVPMLYTVPEGPMALATCKALFVASSYAKYLKFVADLEDNSVDAVGTMPVADSKVTLGQFSSFLDDFPAAIDYFHKMIQRAIETGEIVEPDPEELDVDAILKEIKGLEADDLVQLREAIDELENAEAASTIEEL